MEWFPDLGLWQAILHFLLCNNRIFPGCIGHPTKDN